MSALALREVTVDDAALLREWRNDPSVRASSFNQDAVAADAHRAWLTKKLASADTKMWILTADGVPAGQVRYDKTGEQAEVSVSLDARFRGMGLGVAILTMSAPRACRELGLREIRAVVKLTNAASLNAFARAGFRRGPDAEVHGDPSAILLWSCVPPSP
ncbi:MAG TPA: GNAT family N-acetyltransferase [Thermoanaerobaculia bacterium]|nr:GNAT family N-acetyltransferase [Thermoanaerobaculia bacterium]